MSEKKKKKTIVIAFVNHKGGVAKTTSVVNLSTLFGKYGLRTLVCDTDAQANSCYHLGGDRPTSIKVRLEHVLENNTLIAEAIHPTRHENVSVIYSSLSLNPVADKLQLGSVLPAGELRLALEPVMADFDVILIDCPPDVRLMTSAAIAASTHIIIPVLSGDMYGVEGLADMLKHIEKLKMATNPDLEILGALISGQDDRETVSKASTSLIKRFMNDRVLPVRIRVSTKIKQGIMKRKTIQEMDSGSKSARDFRALAKYIIQETGLADRCNIPAEAPDLEASEAANG